MTGHNEIRLIAEGIPRTISTAGKLFGFTGLMDFVKYTVCPKCHAIYEFDDCVDVTTDVIPCTKYYQFVAFPNHTSFPAAAM